MNLDGQMLVETASRVSLVLILLSATLAFLRLVKGPQAADRVVALDLIAVLVVAFLAASAVFSGETAFLDVAIAYALIAFLGTVALARFLIRSRSNPPGQGSMREKMNELLAAVLLIAGSVFCLVAAVGVLRLPDTLIRMHAATKAGTLGAGCILMAEALSAGNLDTTIKVIAIIVFLLLTAPVAAHLLGRAAYHRGIRLYKKTWIDELADTLKKVSSDEKKRDKEPG